MSLNEQILTNHPEFLNTLRHRFLDENRIEALTKFAELGFPTRRDEEYKYTSIKESRRKIIIFSRKKIITSQKSSLSNSIWEKKISTGLSLLMVSCTKSFQISL